MYPHRIRLRGPWECEPLRGRGPAEVVPPFRAVLPACWGDLGLADFAGLVRFRRRFGRPSRIDAHERAWLVLDETVGVTTVHLNGKPLSSVEGVSPWECEITSLLEVRNELHVDIEGEGAAYGIRGEVALEMRCLAFLRDLEVSAGLAQDPRLTVRGTIAGQFDGPLELYVLSEGRTVAYAPARIGPFQLLSEPLSVAPESGAPIQVELVQGASRWYTAVLAI